ncbi:MAG: thrombospondin type 3 repeat-containing protein [Stagnimonas sp.]|nr:thrombospondin type 3 repeat-containing protein [Stagnimonas sp.]
MVANANQQDVDGDGKGDACDSVNDLDVDGDGISNASDNCPASPNAAQADGDGDGVGDVCDATDNQDIDGDSVSNAGDNCPSVPNASQANIDGDDFGDACDASQGNGGGAASARTAGAPPVEAGDGQQVRVGTVAFSNRSAKVQTIRSVRLHLDQTDRIAKLWAVGAGVHFSCGPATVAQDNICTPDSPLQLPAGQVLNLDVYVEIGSAAAKAARVSLLEDLGMGGAGTVMLVGLLGFGRRRRELAALSLLAVLSLSACGGGGKASEDLTTPPAVDKSAVTVRVNQIDIRDDQAAPVDYGLPVEGVEVGKVRPKD